MHKVSLADFVADKGQSHAAALLGMTQPGLSKALRAGREIYVTETSTGRFMASEVRPFPSQQRREQATG
ncbi:Cro/CI family transcriptional regulator [Isoalcanivorax beigongshangi]|uniref:Cro/CI family transcriptional regulator n=1 Tax=Isoalcanivorax beigongshangi TaxID=3238810 RepID=A0ABV4AFS4_9GAMM